MDHVAIKGERQDQAAPKTEGKALICTGFYFLFPTELAVTLSRLFCASVSRYLFCENHDHY